MYAIRSYYGGQQQQLALGRAMALDPKLLILDEPTEGIAPKIVQLIGDTVTRLFPPAWRPRSCTP